MIRGRHQVVAAGQATLQTYLPATLAAAATDFGWDPADVPAVKSWRMPSMREMRGGDPATPLIVITSTGWVEEPEVDNDGDAHAVYDLLVNPNVRGSDYEHTATVTSIYAAAIRTCLEQHRSLGVDWVTDLKVVAESFDEGEDDKQRLLAEALIVAHVHVGPIHNRHDVPGEDDAPTVLTTDVTVDYLEEE